MKRRTFLQAGLGWSIGTTLVAAVKQQKLDAAANVLVKATNSGEVDAASLVVEQGSQVFARSFGKAKTIDAIFLLASISKPISIAAVMTLFDKKKFLLDDLVTKFIPEFKGEGRDKITIRQLLTHVSGLPDQLPQNKMLRSQHARLSDFTNGAIRTPLLFKPGSRYSYSSMAILLATEIAQRITGASIHQLVNESVCKPLGMKHSALGIGKFKLETLMRCQVENAAPESGAGDPSTKSWDWNSAYWRQLGVPWGGAHGSAPDVARFLKSFLHPEGTILKPDTARLMVTNHNAKGIRLRGLGFDIGKGVGPSSSETTFGHTGSTGTLCWSDPATDTTCVVLTTLPARAVSPHPRNVTNKFVVEAVG